MASRSLILPRMAFSGLFAVAGFCRDGLALSDRGAFSSIRFRMRFEAGKPFWPTGTDRACGAVGRGQACVRLFGGAVAVSCFRKNASRAGKSGRNPGLLSIRSRSFPTR